MEVGLRYLYPTLNTVETRFLNDTPITHPDNPIGKLGFTLVSKPVLSPGFTPLEPASTTMAPSLLDHPEIGPHTNGRFLDPAALLISGVVASLATHVMWPSAALFLGVAIGAVVWLSPFTIHDHL